jgi:hypothetical protein
MIEVKRKRVGGKMKPHLVLEAAGLHWVVPLDKIKVGGMRFHPEGSKFDVMLSIDAGFETQCEPAKAD